MKRAWAVLLLLIGVMASSPAGAQRGQGCNLDRIRAQFERSETFPSLVGCRPDDVRPILQNQDYGLTIENRVASETVRAGRIVSQRRGDGDVYVAVSTGPPPRQREEQDDQFGRVVGEILIGAIEGAANSPRDQPSPRPDPYRPGAQAPDPALVSVLTTPVVAPPVVQPPPPVVQTPPPVVQPPPPVVRPPPPTRVVDRPPPPVRDPVDTQRASRLAQAARATPPPPPPPPPEPAPPVEIIPTPPPADEAVVPAAPIPPKIPPPPVTRFSIHGSPSAAEGEILTLTIRREESDGKDHRIALAYSDKSLLDSPPGTFEFRADMPDEMPLPLRTAKVAGDGDRRLTVTLRANEGRPVSLMAVILDRTSWWEKLLQALASVPIWAGALAGAGAVAGAAALMMPRASCSIGKGSVDLGGSPLKSRWPAVDVDTIIGDAEFSLPIGRRNNAEPSPA